MFFLVLLLSFVKTKRDLEDQSSLLFYAHRFKELQDSLQCSHSSPIYDIDYGNSKVLDVKGVYLCDQYAKRTCCSEQNFNEVKMKWFKEYSQATNISPACQEMFQKMVCYDCDGDIGTKIRRGLCPTFCSQLYKSCYYDLFHFDEKIQKLRFCRQNDIICSELRYMFNEGKYVCKQLGFEVNENINYEDWMDDLLTNITKKQQVCWDGTPSQKVGYLYCLQLQIFGPAFDINTNNIYDKMKDNFKDTLKRSSSQTTYYIYITVGFFVLVLILSIFFLRRMKI